jgi:hypothetical protein
MKFGLNLFKNKNFIELQTIDILYAMQYTHFYKFYTQDVIHLSKICFYKNMLMVVHFYNDSTFQAT